MKRIGYLFKQICSEENIKQAIIEASKRKTNRNDVKQVLNRIDYYVSDIKRLLETKAFSNSEPRIVYKYEKMQSKTREIAILPFYPDHIIHHALIRVIRPYLFRGMYYYSCGSVPGRGEKHIRLNLPKILKKDAKNSKYCLKADIKQFYPSISTYEMKMKLRTLFKDNDLLWLLDTIVDVQERGLPLGSYCSQWLANFYLQDLDHFIKEKLKLSYYFRYADDIVVLHGNKRELKKAINIISEYLFFRDLDVKKTFRIFIVDNKNCIDFVGYKFYRHKISIRKKIFKNIRRKIIRIRRKILMYKRVIISEVRSLMSYLGYIKNSNSYLIRNKYLKYLPIKQLKKALN